MEGLSLRCNKKKKKPFENSRPDRKKGEERITNKNQTLHAW
jgi:hypothetical protein